MFECISFSDTYGDLFHSLAKLMEAKGLVWKEEMVMISDWEQVRVTIGMEILMEKFLRQRDLLGKKHSMWSCGDVCSTLVIKFVIVVIR